MNEKALSRWINMEIERLIGSLHIESSEELRQRLFEIAMKSSTEEGSMGKSSLQQSMQRVTAKVKGSGDERSVQQCKESLQKFADNHAISNKFQIITMLTKLSQLSKENEEDVPMMLRPIRYDNFSISKQLQINSMPLNEAPREDERVIKNREDIFLGATEQQVVKELLYVFTNSKEKEGEYQLRENVEASGTVRRMASHIADLGWLHNKIINSKQRQGMIAKSLREAMHAQLQQFYTWNSKLELLTRENRLSMRKLYVKSFLPQLVLTWLATILDAVEPFNGCEIISMVNSYRPNGSEAVNSLINRILCIIIQPLLRYIHSWMYMGVLYDPHQEFFIAENKDASECDEWKMRFTLIKEMVPNILNEQAAIMILNTGKSISFLKSKCKVYYDIKIPFIEQQQIKKYISRGYYSFKGDFMKWLNEVYTEVNHALLRTLFEEFHLRYHFQSMKNFYLMGKGDFCQHLYDLLKIQLSLEEDMSLNKLDAIISDTALKCFNDFKLPNSSEYYRKSVGDRLLAKMVKYEGGNNIWDFINFEYSLQRIELLRNFFSPSTMENYERIFSFLWKIKQIIEILKDLWVLQSKQASKIRRVMNNELSKMHHTAYLLRNSMNHFMTNLHNYLMVAIESSWKKFDEEINSIANFDDILSIHKNFQQEILEITFNTASQQPTRAMIIDVFAAISTFRIIYQRLEENIDGYHDVYRTKEERTSLSKRLNMSEPRDIFSYHFEDSHREIIEISSGYNRIFLKFYTQINKQDGSDRNSLSARLNFSQYYFKDDQSDSLSDELQMN